MSHSQRLTYSTLLAFGLLVWAGVSGVGPTPACAQAGCAAPNFAAATNFAAGDQPSAVAAGDFNGDGNIDLVPANLNSANVSVLLGNGAGGFTGNANFPAGLGPNSVGVGDFNGDGKTDLAVANQNPNPGAPEHSVSILIGVGDGTFSAPTDFTAGQFPRSLVVGDFTGDGKADLAVANSTTKEIRVLPGTGTGSLGAPVVTPVPQAGLTGVFKMAAGDFNGDGKTDLVGLREKETQPPFGPGGVSVFLGTGAGSFTAGETRAIGVNPGFVVVGNINGDAFSDLAVANRASNNVSVLLGAGDGTFSAAQTFAAGGTPESVAVGDFNLDGRNDLAVARRINLASMGGDEVVVFLSDGAGGLSASASFAVGNTPFHILTSDFDKDGKADLATANFNSKSVSVLLNRCGSGAAQAIFRFEHPSYFIHEEQTFMFVRVARTGLSSAAATVDYRTEDGTASERSDYTTALGTLSFAPGETLKGFTALISEDSLVEGAERFTVALINPTAGATLGAQNTAIVEITDDPAEPSRNEIDDAELFVGQHYHDFLNRRPDQSGLFFWRDGIRQCGADTGCQEVRRINTSGAFFLSIEFQETGYLAYRTYKAAYGDATSPNVPGTVPVIRLREFLADAQRIGQGVVVNQGDWRGQLEANKRDYALGFVGRTRFLSAFPASLTAEEFVSKLDQNAGQVLSADERAQLVSALGAAPSDPAGRAAALLQVAEHAALKQREFNRAFVLMQYYGYLRRNPDDAPDGDFRGWRFWLDKLDQFNGNFIQAEMVKAFISSDEYRKRFGP